MTTRVELLYDAECPNVGMARAHLLRAFASAGLIPCWREWRRDDSRSPERVQTYGSPTILVDGRDVAPLTNNGTCCRLYAQGDDGSVTGVPPVELSVMPLQVTEMGKQTETVPVDGCRRSASLYYLN